MSRFKPQATGYDDIKWNISVEEKVVVPTVVFKTYEELKKKIWHWLMECRCDRVRVSRSKRGEWGEWFEVWEVDDYLIKMAGKVQIFKAPKIIKEGWM